jgi:hypothetical protein
MPREPLVPDDPVPLGDPPLEPVVSVLATTDDPVPLGDPPLEPVVFVLATTDDPVPLGDPPLEPVVSVLAMMVDPLPWDDPPLPVEPLESSEPELATTVGPPPLELGPSDPCAPSVPWCVAAELDGPPGLPELEESPPEVGCTDELPRPPSLPPWP